MVEELEENAFAVFLFHPGAPGFSGAPEVAPDGLSLLVIRIPDLMDRATTTLAQSTEVHLYDTTGKEELFLGGGRWTVEENNNKDYTLFAPQTLADVARQSELYKKTDCKHC